MKKYIFIVLLIWAFTVLVSLGRDLEDNKREFEGIAKESAKAFFNQIIITRFWNAFHNGVYVPITEKTKPNPYLVDPLRDLTTTNGIKLTKINPAFMTRQISEIALEKSSIQFHITSLNPLRPGNKPTPWEESWLNSFEKGTKEQSSFVHLNIDNDKKFLYRYMEPLHVEKPCLSCHEKQGYKLGDVRGGLSITLSYLKPPRNHSIYARHGIGFMIGLGGFLFAGILIGGSHKSLVNSNQKKQEALTKTIILSKDLKKKNEELDENHQKLKDTYKKLEITQVQMLQNEKMASIGQLSAGIAHEINNPLGFITSNLSTLREYIDRMVKYVDFQSEIIKSLNAENQVAGTKKHFKVDFIIEDSKELLNESVDGTNRVSEIVKNLISFSRIDKENVIDININECIENTLRFIWNELKQKAIVIKNFGDTPLTVCNAQELNHVFMNIIINASQSIEKKGEITIKTEQVLNYIHISISDTGTGIKSQDIGRIFEPFFTTKDVGKGKGLGLAMCYDIIKRHEGEILVESEYGKGTTFTIIIPIKKNVIQAISEDSDNLTV